MSGPLTLLSDEGVAVWLDDMSPERLVSGNLKALVRDKQVAGVTTNPTISPGRSCAGRPLGRCGR